MCLPLVTSIRMFYQAAYLFLRQFLQNDVLSQNRILVQLGVYCMFTVIYVPITKQYLRYLNCIQSVY